MDQETAPVATGSPAATSADAAAPEGARVARWISRAGLASRREAERMIAQGRVSLDGAVLDNPATVIAHPDRLAVDGQPLPAPAPARLFRFAKPAGVLVAASDSTDRPTIYDHLPDRLPRVMPVGRLDLASEGLLLLTTDGALKRRLELPATGWLRRYRVRVHGPVDAAALAALAEGVTVEGVRYGPIRAALERRTGANAWLTVSLREGRNREVRRVLAHLGLQVNRLVRVAYGPFQLGNMRPGQVSEVPAKVLAEQLGQDPDALGTPQAATGTPKTGGRHAHRRRPA